MDQSGKSATVVPMRFYANWDMDRTSSSAIPRTLSMIFTKLVLTKNLTTDNTLAIAVRLQGHRRTLRSNDINIYSLPKLDNVIDISFTIQYCHFIKRKSNILQLLIQRRKKYKNRQIPGFKTLAVGHINLDQILQQGGSIEVSMWGTACLNKSGPSVNELHAGIIYISNCYTQVFDTEQDLNKWNKSSNKYSNVLSEEDEDSTAEDSDFDDYLQRRRPTITDGVGNINHSENRGHSRQMRENQNRMKINQKNIKQKVVALLRRFRIPDEEENASVIAGSSTSRVKPPTELELQEIFEELENISDSGPEVEPDKMSIISNPRPGIRPFFGSKSNILPAIKDQVINSDESGDTGDEPEISSEENPKESNFWTSLNIQDNFYTPTEAGNPNPNLETNNSARKDFFTGSTSSRDVLKHSSTINSIINSNPSLTTKEIYPKLVTQGSLSARYPTTTIKKSLDSTMIEFLFQFDNSPTSLTIPDNVWLCSSTDLPWISRIDPNKLPTIRLFDCQTTSEVRTLLQAIISRIQKFCNSNSVAPLTTRINILGGDKLVSRILRVYVDLMQNKAFQDWLGYLRFSLLIPPHCTIGRLVGQVGIQAATGVLDSTGGSTQFYSSFTDPIWRFLNRLSGIFDSGRALNQTEYQDLDAWMANIGGAGILSDMQQVNQRAVNLAIGEIMMQLESNNSSDILQLQPGGTFVPFISELRFGYVDDTATSSSLFYIKNSIDDNSQTNSTTAGNVLLGVPPNNPQSGSVLPSSQSQSFTPFSSIGANSNLSPPVSPSILKLITDLGGRELNIEYWTSAGSVLSSTVLNGSLGATAATSYQEYSKLSPGIPITFSKFSMKAIVRTLSVGRETTTNFLCMMFVKEKKKDKVLQKLGRKNKQRNSNDFNSQSEIVSSVSRMICSSSSNKNPFLDICIDGVLWRKVRYFQVSHQWQTHVKLFPIFFPTISQVPISIASIGGSSTAVPTK